MLKVTFDNKQSPFFKEIKEKVDRYFLNRKIDPSGNGRLYFKSIIQVLSSLALYLTLVFFTPTPLVALSLCCLLGFNLAVIGFNVMHEGGHQSFSKYAWLNKVTAYSLNV